jgi:hypothetical protein
MRLPTFFTIDLTRRSQIAAHRIGVFLPVQTCAQLAIHFETLILQPAWRNAGIRIYGFIGASIAR